MINFLSKWIEQIAISVILVSIFELILPKGNLKKYIKVVLGVYIIFSIISPFVDKSKLYDIGDINIEQYVKATNQSENKINQEAMDKRLQNLYIEEIEKNISKKVEENGYVVSKCDIDATLDSNTENAGIHNINLTLNKKEISTIEKVQIGDAKTLDDNKTDEEVAKIRKDLASYYEIDENIINVSLK